MSEIQSAARETLSIINDLPDEIIEKVISAWEEGREIDRYSLPEITGVSGERMDRLTRLLENEKNHKTLHSMFVTGLIAKSEHGGKANKIEIVWTGPSLETGMDILNTKSVIEKMLTDAREKVTIIDYRITSNAESIVEELNKCLSEGVNLELIVDNHKANEKELRKCFSEISLAKPRIFMRKEKESKYFKVHAKVLIKDDMQMLIGSANLTELGTEVNFELGVLIEGPLVKQMLRLLSEMKDAKYFEEVE